MPLAPIGEVFAPHLNTNVKFGRKRPAGIPPRFRLGSYLRATLPAPPASVDYSGKALASLRDVYANDQLGCCVVAGRYHGVGVASGNADHEFHATTEAIIKEYSAIGGYIPGDPSTDTGLDEGSAQNYWTTHGFVNGVKPLGAITIDATDWTEVKTAIWLFEGADICVELPNEWINPFPSTDGFVWDNAPPNPQQGHCFEAFGYDDAKGVRIDSWGLFGWITPAALKALAVPAGYGSMYIVLTPDLLAKGASKVPCGLDWRSLVQDFDMMGGNVPIPAAPAPPVPAPAPGSPVTLAQAQAWVDAAINSGHALMTRSQAVAAANAGLAAHWPKP